MPFAATFLALLVVASFIVGVVGTTINKNYTESDAHKVYNVIIGLVMLVTALVILI